MLDSRRPIKNWQIIEAPYILSVFRKQEVLPRITRIGTNSFVIIRGIRGERNKEIFWLYRVTTKDTGHKGVIL